MNSNTQSSRKHKRSKAARALAHQTGGPVATLEVQGRLVRVKVPTGPGTQRGGGRRGRVGPFSRSSRKRMMDLFLTIAWESLTAVIFITLTYPQEFPDPSLLKEHRRRFVERLRRRFPKASSVYRLEFQKRGAPHWHFLWFGLPFLPKLDLQRIWMGCIVECLSPEQALALERWEKNGIVPERHLRPFTRIEAIQSWRKAIYYVSKYMAKVDADVGAEGASDAVGADVGAPDAVGVPSGLSGFNLYTYLHGAHVGRWWGKHNRVGIPSSESTSGAWLIQGPWFWKFRRAAARKWKGIKRKNARGFTLYTGGGAEQWWRVLDWAMEGQDSEFLRMGVDWDFFAMAKANAVERYVPDYAVYAFEC